jgi:hypothetical protein
LSSEADGTQLDFFAQAQKPLHTYKILALILSLPVTFLAWAALTFAAAIVVMAWEGIDATFVEPQDIKDFKGAGALQFGRVTAWVTTVALILLVFGVFSSYVFFLNVSAVRLLFPSIIAAIRYGIHHDSGSSGDEGSKTI